MKFSSLRILVLAALVAVGCFAGVSRASAAVDIGINVGGPPPAPVYERRWAPPYRGAVWVGGHHEWRGGAWVWVGGYYAYPPYPGAVWIPGHYRRGYWHPGHWRR